MPYTDDAILQAAATIVAANIQAAATKNAQNLLPSLIPHELAALLKIVREGIALESAAATKRNLGTMEKLGGTESGGG